MVETFTGWQEPQSDWENNGEERKMCCKNIGINKTEQIKFKRMHQTIKVVQKNGELSNDLYNLNVLQTSAPPHDENSPIYDIRLLFPLSTLVFGSLQNNNLPAESAIKLQATSLYELHWNIEKTLKTAAYTLVVRIVWNLMDSKVDWNLPAIQFWRKSLLCGWASIISDFCLKAHFGWFFHHLFDRMRPQTQPFPKIKIKNKSQTVPLRYCLSFTHPNFFRILLRWTSDYG